MIVKSNDFLSRTNKGHASTPYNSDPFEVTILFNVKNSKMVQGGAILRPTIAGVYNKRIKSRI